MTCSAALPPPPCAVLLGRLPGCTVRGFTAPRAAPAGEAECRAWLGLGGEQQQAAAADAAAAAAGGEPALEPASCLLFASPATADEIYDCLAGLQTAFPRLLLTGALCGRAGAAVAAVGRAAWHVRRPVTRGTVVPWPFQAALRPAPARSTARSLAALAAVATASRASRDMQAWWCALARQRPHCMRAAWRRRACTATARR